MLSIYGNLDGCLSMRGYEKYKKNWSADSAELIIKGGNHSNFGKSVADNGYGMLRTFLAYKLDETGGELIKVDRFFPSSKRCSKCESGGSMSQNAEACMIAVFAF